MKRLFAGAALMAAAALPAFADNFVNDDQIVRSSLCVGLDCVNDEDFGFDTIRLKENNTRIRFDDTSSSGSFPRTDWQLTANDSANGGRERFSIEDDTNEREIFTLMGGAPSYSLFVQEDGSVGVGTNDPRRTVHVASGNNPTLRLEQTAAGGFPAATWDIGVTEAGLTIALDGTPMLGVDPDGNLLISGSLTSGAPAGDFPDYVFAPDYRLMPLAELQAFVERERHLPGVPSAREVQRDGLDMTELQVRLLEKVEELTLYTMQQQERIEALEAELRAAR